MSTPRQDGLFMPAEGSAHARCWMAWPCNKARWGERLAGAVEAYTTVAKAIAAFEPMTILAAPECAAGVSLRTGTGVSVLTVDTEDSWIRDNGPTFVIDGKGGVAGVHWRFNAWGERYPDYAKDAAVGEAVLASLAMRRYRAPLVLEGGSIHVDGEGTVLTTEQCLLNPNRNPGLDRGEIEGLLCDFLGAGKVIWLAGGLEGDETDGHVDNVACFASPGLVITLTSRDADDGNTGMLEENLARLRSATDAKGRRLEVIEIVQPARVEHEGKRLPLSYINFYLANGAVIAPQFEDPADKAALAALKTAFPDRKIVPVDALDLAYGGGGIHCITQQQPAGEPLAPIEADQVRE